MTPFREVGRGRYYRITIKTSQPLFEKVFANGNGLAGIISSVSGLYLLGRTSGPALGSRFLHRIKTSVAGDDGFSWFNSSTLAIAFIQDGDIYYTAKANHAPYNLSYNAKDWGLSQGGLSKPIRS